MSSISDRMGKSEYFFYISMLALMSVIALMSTDVYIPAMPVMAEYFNVSEKTMQTTLSIYLSGFAISQIFYGILSDRLGRKPVLLAGIVLYLFATLAASMAPTIEFLIVARFFQAIGACSGLVISRAIIGDKFRKDEQIRVFSTIFPLIGVSPAIAPVIGGLLTSYFNWRANFFFLMFMGFSLLLMMIFLLRETHPKERRIKISAKNLFNSYKSFVTSLPFVCYTLVVCSCYGAYFVFLSESSFVFADLGFRSEYVSIFFLLVSLGYISGNLISKIVVKRFSSDDSIAIGFGLSLSGMFIMLFLALDGGVTNPLEISIPMMIASMGNGFLLPIGTASVNSLFPHLYGTASGFMGLMTGSSAAVSAKLVGYIAHGKPLYMVMFMIFIYSIGAVALFIIRSHNRRIKLADSPA